MGLAQAKPLETAELPAAPPQFTVVPQPAAAPTLKKKLDLGGIGKTPKAKASEKIHPVADADEELQQAVAQFCEIKPRFEADKETIESILRPQILSAVAPQILASRSGEFSMLVMGPLPEAPGQPQAKIMVTLQNRYPVGDYDTVATALLPVLGEQRFEQYFQQGVTLSIDMDAMPEENQQAFVEELTELAARHNAGEAIKAKDTLKPKPGFHEARRSVFTAEENLAIYGALPNVGIVKLKNVRS